MSLKNIFHFRHGKNMELYTYIEYLKLSWHLSAVKYSWTFIHVMDF
jgi:hypothetical protein